MNGFDLLLGNDALSQLGSFSVQYDKAGVGSFSLTATTNEDVSREKGGDIVNHETVSIPAFSMVYVDTVVWAKSGTPGGTLAESHDRQRGLDRATSPTFSRSQRDISFPLDKLFLIRSVYPSGNGRW